MKWLLSKTFIEYILCLCARSCARSGTISFHLVNTFILSPYHKPSSTVGTGDNNREKKKILGHIELIF